jgi:hypothetical protein
LDDYYRAKDNTPLKVSIETIEKESDTDYELEALFPSDENETDEIEVIDPEWEDSDIEINSHFDKTELEESFCNMLMREYFFDLTRINFHIKKENYEEAMFLEREALRSFLVNFYCQFHPNERLEISDAQTQNALEFIDQYLDLPVSTKQFLDYLDLTQLGNLEQEKRNLRLRDNFEKFLRLFHTLHDFFIAKDNGGEL